MPNTVPRLRSGAILFLLMLGWSPTHALAEAQDPRVLLDRMQLSIAGLEAFRIDSDAYMDARLPAGQIIEHASQVTVGVIRPATMRLTSRSADSTKDIYFNQGILTLHRTEEGFYGQQEIPGDIDQAVGYVIDQFGIDAPLLDFISSESATALLAEATQVDYFGPALIRNRLHDHIGIRMDEADIQVWISAEAPHLPGKLSISNKWEGGAPRSVSFMSWDTDPDFPDIEILRFDPPAGAVKIEILRDAVEEEAGR